MNGRGARNVHSGYWETIFNSKASLHMAFGLSWETRQTLRGPSWRYPVQSLAVRLSPPALSTVVDFIHPSFKYDERRAPRIYAMKGNEAEMRVLRHSEGLAMREMKGLRRSFINFIKKGFEAWTIRYDRGSFRLRVARHKETVRKVCLRVPSEVRRIKASELTTVACSSR